MYRVRAWMFGLLLMLSLSARAELRLVCDIKGSVVVVTHIGAQRLIGSDGVRSIGIPLDAAFRIEGDLRENAGLVLWSPTYEISHRKTPRGQRPWLGYVALTSGRNQKGTGFSQVWPKFDRELALAVLAWVVDGKIVQVKVHLLPTPLDGTFRMERSFPLSATEARGQGVVLVWADGRFILPRPWFKDAATQAVLERMLSGDESVLARAIGQGLKVGATSREGATLLQFAAEAGMVEAVSLLLSHGAKFSVMNYGSPLDRAAANGRMEVVERLVAAKPKPKPGLVDRFVVMGNGHDAEMIFLLATGTISVPKDFLLLEMAMRQGSTDLVRLLLKKGMMEKVPRLERPGRFMEQVKLGHIDIVRLLLEQKHSPNVSVDGTTPLHEAARSRDPALVNLLLLAGAQVNLVDSTGHTPLMLACTGGNIEAVRSLIDAGADVNFRPKDGNSCLHYAALHDSVALTDLLLKHGADIDSLGVGKLRPLEIALLARAGIAARLLSAKGASCDLDRNEKAQLIEAAVNLDVVEVVRNALTEGWSADAMFDQRWPAVWFAELSGAMRVKRLLVSAGAKTSGVDLPHLVPLTELESAPRLVESSSLTDPRGPSHNGERQIVKITLIVNEHGSVVLPRIHSSPAGQLSLVVLQAVRSWRFTVPTRHAKPVCTEITVPVLFGPTEG